MQASTRVVALAAYLGLLALTGCRDKKEAHTISGAISGATADGVVITLSGTGTGTTTSAGGGLYSFPDVEDGSYTLTPSKAVRISFDVVNGTYTGAAAGWYVDGVAIDAVAP